VPWRDEVCRTGWRVRLCREPCFRNAALADTPKPNIIFILADDLGWKDVGFTFRHQDTNIDKLAEPAHGSKNTTSSDVHADARGVHDGAVPFPVRAPDGGHPSGGRYGVATTSGCCPNPQGGGYQTAIVANGTRARGSQVWPSQRGFDYSYGLIARSITSSTNRMGDGLVRNSKPLKERAYDTTLSARRVRLIGEQDTKTPLFLYLASRRRTRRIRHRRSTWTCTAA